MYMQPVYIVLGVALFFINILAVVMVGLGKQRSVRRSERFPEVYFFFLGSCFASAGVLAGMFLCTPPWGQNTPTLVGVECTFVCIYTVYIWKRLYPDMVSTNSSTM